MAKVGYQLIRRSTGRVVKEWGGVWGQSPEIPNPLILPNGDHVCGATLGSYGGFDLVEWDMPPGPANVRDEAARRIVAALGARDAESAIHKQLNLQAKFNRLNRRLLKGVQLTAEQEAELDAIEAIYDEIDRIRLKSNELEALDVIPEPLTDDKFWA